MTAYYNEIDPYAAQWLRNLISAGHIAPGDVDERSIVDVRGADLAGHDQCHFFAGIGGWSVALRLAGWDDDRPVWTGSCPCQPFSSAGKRKGGADNRHLWPHWFRLIRERSPAVIFGEQVARAVGSRWLDAVAHDLEGELYAFGAAVLPACAVRAPHQRDRLWFVANTDGAELRQQPGRRSGANGASPSWPGINGAERPLANTDHEGEPARGQEHILRQASQAARSGECGAIGEDWWAVEPDVGRVAHGVPNRVDKLRAYGNAIVPQVAAKFIEAAM